MSIEIVVDWIPPMGHERATAIVYQTLGRSGGEIAVLIGEESGVQVTKKKVERLLYEARMMLCDASPRESKTYVVHRLAVNDFADDPTRAVALTIEELATGGTPPVISPVNVAG